MTHYRVDHDVAELAIGHQRQGLDKLYDFAELWELRRDAFTTASRPWEPCWDLFRPPGSRADT